MPSLSFSVISSGGSTTPVPTLAALGVKGRVDSVSLLFSAHIENPGSPPPDGAIVIALYVGPQVVRVSAGTDSNGDIAATATLSKTDAKGTLYSISFDPNSVSTPNGIAAFGTRVVTGVDDAWVTEASFSLSYTASLLNDFGGSSPPPPPSNPNTSEPGGNVNVTWENNDPTQDGTMVTKSVDGDTPSEYWVSELSTEFLDTDADTTEHQYEYCMYSVKGDSHSTPVCTTVGTPGAGCARLLPWTITVTPAVGSIAGGTTLTIDGVVTDIVNPATGLPYALRVNIDGDILVPTILDDNTITVVTLAHLASLEDVIVYRPETGDQVTAEDAFAFVDDTPTITAVTATSGPMSGGTTITISGSGFKPGSTVYFGDVPAVSSTYISPSEYQAVTPAHVVGATDVFIIEP